MGISVFYHSLEVGVKVVSVNMKSGTMNVVFMAITQNNLQNIVNKILKSWKSNIN